MEQKQTNRDAWQSALLGVGLLMLASQVYISLLFVDFKISVAIVLLPILAFLSPQLPALPFTLLTAPGVFLLRLLFQFLSGGTLVGSWQAHGPEMLFYLSYVLLFFLYWKKVPLRPVATLKFLPLIAIDTISNFLELALRLGEGALAPDILPQLLAVGCVRTLLAWAVIRTMDAYSFQVLRREDKQRYQRLLLMTASLKSEVAWMEKGTALIENTMNTAYHLYSRLRSENADPAAVDAALTIAKDIHEVKKEYFLIMRGISGALETDSVGPGIGWEELVEILRQSTLRSAQASGKDIRFAAVSVANFATQQHHALMSIFHNLLHNAVEAAPYDAPAQLTLRQSREGKDFCFTVEDDCGGIPPQRLPQIFTPGFSSKINPATGEINRGLGLCIVKGLVEEKLHGSIAVDCPDGGTRFTIRIPCEQLEDS